MQTYFLPHTYPALDILQGFCQPLEINEQRTQVKGNNGGGGGRLDPATWRQPVKLLNSSAGQCASQRLSTPPPAATVWPRSPASPQTKWSLDTLGYSSINPFSSVINHTFPLQLREFKSGLEPARAARSCPLNHIWSPSLFHEGFPGTLWRGPQSLLIYNNLDVLVCVCCTGALKCL